MLKERIREFLGRMRQTLLQHPAEATVCLIFCIYAIFRTAMGSNKLDESYLLLFPIFFFFSLALGRSLGNSRAAWIYWLSGLLPVPFLWVDCDWWVNSVQYPVAILLCVLAVLASGWQRDNRRFVADALTWFWSALFAGILTGIAYGLILAIYFSLIYLFPVLEIIPDRKFVAYTAEIVFMLILPLTFLTLARSGLGSEEKIRLSGFGEVLVNYILTPALLIYTIILYAYLIRIVLEWELPEGMLAAMVFCFTLAGFLTKALHALSVKGMWNRFYHRFELITLPTQVMFWIGTLRRVTEYGFTESRVYLVACGILMTGTLVAFLWQRSGRYLWVSCALAGVLAVITYIPGLKAADLALRSQHARFVRAARTIGLFDANGYLSTEKQPDSDTVYRKEYGQLRDAYRYLRMNENADVMQNRYGELTSAKIESEIMLDALQERTSVSSYRRNTTYSISTRQVPSIDLSGYSVLYSVYDSYREPNTLYYERSKDRESGVESLLLYDHTGKEVLNEKWDTVWQRQLRKAGLSEGKLTRDLIQQHTNSLLVYETDRGTVIFTSWLFSGEDTVKVVRYDISHFLMRKQSE